MQWQKALFLLLCGFAPSTRASELSAMCSDIIDVLGRSPSPIELALESTRLAADRRRVQALPQSPGKVSRSERDESTVEPNAYWDPAMLGRGDSWDGGPATSYSAYAVDTAGNALTGRVDFEFGWGRISPHTRGTQMPFRIGETEAHVVIVGRRWTPGGASRYTVRLPDSISAAAIPRLAAEHSSPGTLFFTRNYSPAENAILNLLTTAANREMTRLQSGGRAPSERALRQLVGLRGVEIPPNAEPNLIYTGQGAPAVPRESQLHLSAPAIREGRVVYGFLSTDRSVVRVNRLPDGRIRVTTIDSVESLQRWQQEFQEVLGRDAPPSTPERRRDVLRRFRHPPAHIGVRTMDEAEYEQTVRPFLHVAA